MRVGYAVEYDFVSPDQAVRVILETKINPLAYSLDRSMGTSGYEWQLLPHEFIAGITQFPSLCRRGTMHIAA
jgi:tRNA U34 5-carboxymethylaminomethyl modifying enzyme MnmG/GidA